jgi:hypothetical protein
MGKYACVADQEFGLQVIDVANPWNPVIVGNVETPGSAHGVVLSGTYAYVADLNAGLHIIDMTDPLTPITVGSVDTPGWAMDLNVSGTLAYVADTGMGVAVIDVGDPFSPQFLGMTIVGDSSSVTEVAVSGDHVFAVDYWTLKIVPAQCELPTGTPMAAASPQNHLSVFPNPSLGPVTIRFHAPLQGPIRTTIYDVSGRIVRNLSDGPNFNAGIYEATWDGLDSNGRKAAAGVYWIRAHTRSGLADQRLTLIR